MQIKTPTPLLQFQNPPKKLTDSLSAAVFVGDDLWVASDETTSVERLSTDDGLTFQHHKSFSLDGLINLPAKGTEFDQEIDIEGIGLSRFTSLADWFAQHKTEESRENRCGPRREVDQEVGDD